MSADKPERRNAAARARPERAAEVQGERRRRTANFDASFDRQLPVDESRLDPSFTYRWVNDVPGRVGKFTQLDDWDPVSPDEVGGPTEFHVGYQRDGSAMSSRLMKKPRKWHDIDQAQKTARTREIDDQMKRRAVPTAEGGLSEDEGYMVAGTGVRAGTAKVQGRQAEVIDEEA